MPDLSHKEFMEVNHLKKSRPALGKTGMNLQRLRAECCIIENGKQFDFLEEYIMTQGGMGET